MKQHRSSVRPAPFPGNASTLCTAQLLVAVLPAGCVGTPGSGSGECVNRIPIERVARGPGSFDLVLSEHRSEDVQPTGLTQLLQYVPLTGAGIASSFRNVRCAAPPGEPVTASSRLHERIFRQDETHVFQASGWTSLD